MNYLILSLGINANFVSLSDLCVVIGVGFLNKKLSTFQYFPNLFSIKITWHLCQKSRIMSHVARLSEPKEGCQDSLYNNNSM